MGALLYFPARRILQDPQQAGLGFKELWFETEDGKRLHGWFIAGRRPCIGHLLFCHGNAGNVGDRLLDARLLAAVGFDVALFDYRGYGRSSGRPDEQGTYLDAEAAREEVLRQPEVGAGRLFYLGESLGGAIALRLALDFPPKGLVLQSTFTSVRDVAHHHYPLIPRTLVPDAYPSLGLIPRLTAPLLILHGERDEIVPLAQGQALFAAAPEPKRLHVFDGLGHNDLVVGAGSRHADVIAQWARQLP